MRLSKHNLLLLSLAFVAGGSMMATELMTARMLAPRYGTSLFVWTAVLCVTLFSLASGYIVGGRISAHYRRDKWLLIALLFAGLAVMFMPFTARFMLSIGVSLDFNTSFAISSLCIIFPPIAAIGMVLPLIVSNLDEEITGSGERAGRVFSSSTIGGIAFTFLFGFYIIPEYGLIIPSLINGFFLGFLPAILLFRKGWNTPGLYVLAGIIAGGLYFYQQPSQGKNVDLLFLQEGLNGQILVADIPSMNEDSSSEGRSRVLMINRIIHSQVNLDTLESSFSGISKYTNQILSTYRENSSVLVIGLGAGIIAMQAQKRGLNVDVVEPNKAIVDAAYTYFGMDTSIYIFRQDPRYFLNVIRKSYDLIIFDSFMGEETPYHLFTAESVSKIRRLLKPSGLVAISTVGFYKGDIGIGTRSLYKTIRAQGLFTEMILTRDNHTNQRMLFLFGETDDAFENHVPTAYETFYINSDSIDVSNAVILTDRRPTLDFLSGRASKAWRLAYHKETEGVFIKDGIPFFN